MFIEEFLLWIVGPGCTSTHETPAAADKRRFAHRRAGDPGGDARGRLIATAMACLRFARARPSRFALPFLALPSARRNRHGAPAAQSPYRLLLERAADFLGDAQAQAESLRFGLWSLVHGAAVLRQTHLRDFAGPIAEATRENLARLLDGWRPAGAAAA